MARTKRYFVAISSRAMFTRLHGVAKARKQSIRVVAEEALEDYLRPIEVGHGGVGPRTRRLRRKGTEYIIS